MPERYHMTHAQYFEQRAGAIIQVIQQARNGEIRLLLAVREIFESMHVPEIEERIKESDFKFITGIRSETDHLPLGSERQYWAPESLREKDLEILSYEAQSREEVLSVFARIADQLREIN
jgi:hypothetical protein